MKQEKKSSVEDYGKILHLTLKKKWFDMILSGEKKEEYREPKQYWITRLYVDGLLFFPPKQFDIIRFKNGYQNDAPEMDVEFISTEHKSKWCKYNKDWGAEEGKDYIVINLGKVISSNNIKK